MPKREQVFSAPSGGLQFATLSGRAILRVQSWMPEESWAQYLGALTQSGWPTKVGATAIASAARVLCLGPVDWLVASEARSNDALRRLCADTLDSDGAIVDLSQGLKIM